jgi:alkyldihydroxyacetonephosphate synthase
VQGAANADRGGIVVDMRRMQAIRHIDELSLTCTVEAGLACRDFEAQLNAQGYTFTHYPASDRMGDRRRQHRRARLWRVVSVQQGTAQIEDHVLSLEFVAPTGEIVNTPGVPRHAAGPELTQLLIGAEGTLGIVTAAVVEIRRLPARRVFGVFRFPDLETGVEAGRRIMVSGLRPGRAALL